MTTAQTFSIWQPVELRRTSILQCTAAAGLLAFVAGTGGDLAAAQVLKRMGGTGSTLQVLSGAQPRAASQGLATELRTIRDALRLSVSELAQLFNVSRPTVYSWQDGKPIKDANAERILAMARALAPHLQLFESQIGRVAHRAIEGRTSLLQWLAEGGEAQQAIQSLSNVLQREAAQRERLAQRLNDRNGKRGIADLDVLA